MALLHWVTIAFAKLEDILMMVNQTFVNETKNDRARSRESRDFEPHRDILHARGVNLV